MTETGLTETIVESEKIVGTKQVLKGIEEGTVKTVVIAEDADDGIAARVRASAAGRGIPVRTAGTKQELGELCGIEVPAACAGLI